MEKTVESQSQQTVSFAWKQHEDLAACMGELYEKSLWTDVKFHCKDHEETVIIHAHKIFLAARSPVFQTMFFGPYADDKENIEFDHAEAKVLDLFLRYIYTDLTDLDEDTAPSVLRVAHFFQITKLVQFCANYLATILTTENACTIFSLSMLYQVTSLRDSCCSFIDKNAEIILHSEGFLELPEECILYIVKGDTFFAKEDMVFTTAEKWAARKLQQKSLEENGPNIRKALGKAFYYLRLPTMAYIPFKNCIRRKGYFSIHEYEDIIDFINRIPLSSVQSNLCVPRIPTEETITLNNERGRTITTDKISSSFQISVTRDLKLSYLTLAKVQQFLQYNEIHFKKTDSPNIPISEEYLDTFFSDNNGKVIQIQISQTGTVFGMVRNKNIAVLTEALGEPLSDEFDIAVSGHFEITCHNDEKKQNEEHGNAYQNVFKAKTPFVLSCNDEDVSAAAAAAAADDDDDDVVDDDDDDVDDGAVDDIKLILEQDFEVLSSKVSGRIIDLKEHVILTAAASPYTFNFTLRYSCDSNTKQTVVHRVSLAKEQYLVIIVDCR